MPRVSHRVGPLRNAALAAKPSSSRFAKALRLLSCARQQRKKNVLIGKKLLQLMIAGLCGQQSAWLNVTFYMMGNLESSFRDRIRKSG